MIEPQLAVDKLETGEGLRAEAEHLLQEKFTPAAAFFGWDKGGGHRGTIILDHYTGVNGDVYLYFAGDLFLSRTFLWAVFDYAFNQARVSRVSAMVAADNKRALKIAGRAGFVKEGVHRLPEKYFFRFGMLREECKWL